MTTVEVTKITVKEAKSLRLEGNAKFKNGDYKGAEKVYSKAIREIESIGEETFEAFELHLLFSNRSACYLNLSEKKLALEDAETAIKIAPTYVKGFVRKAKALVALEQLQNARKVIAEEALKLEPKNLFLKKTLTDIVLKLPVSSFESFMIHYSESKDMRIRLCTLATFWNASSQVDRFAIFRKLNPLIRDIDVNSESIESIMKNFAKEQMMDLPMKNYKDLSLPQDWVPWYKKTSSEEKVKLLAAIWENCNKIERDFIKKDIVTCFFEKRVV